MGEHYPCKVGVMGSNPISSTNDFDNHNLLSFYNEGTALVCHLIGESFNGRTMVSKTIYWGSNPCSPAKHFGVWRSWYRAWFGTKMPWVRVPPLRPLSNLSDWAMRSSPTGIYRLPLNVWLVELVKTVAPQATDRSSSLLPDTNVI